MQGLFHLFAERNIIQHAVAAGDENAEVVAAIQILHHLRQLFRLLELATVLLVGGLDRFVFLRERPHLQLHRITGRRGDVDLETGQIQVIHRQQHLDRVVAGGEELAVLHQQVALLRGDHQHLPLAAAIGVRVAGARKVGFGRGVLAEE